MASIDQVVQQIRFALENLSERNGQHEFTTVLSTMSHLGLEPRHTTPNLEGLREYLRHRWHYWDLDVEYPRVFEGLSE